MVVGTGQMKKKDVLVRKSIKCTNYLQIASTLKFLIDEQGGYVVFLVLSEYLFVRDFRV